jgi:hypothetical protein
MAVVAFALPPSSALAGNGTFVDAPPVAAPFPVDVAVGDFNSDGDEDLAIVDGIGDVVSIRTGLAGATFGAASDVSAGTDAQSASIGDFNSDGDEDLAIADLNGGIVPIRLGSGSAAFTAAANVPSGNADEVAIADFTGDGAEDLAINHYPARKILLRTGTGAGTFGAGPDLTVGAAPGHQPIDVVAADFNNDGDPDLAVLHDGGTVPIFTGTNLPNDATFTAGPELAIPGNAFSFAVGDFNDDADPDLAIGTAAGTVAVRTGGAGASFDVAPDAFAGDGGGVPRIAVGDFNSDGDEDLALSRGSGTVVIRRGAAGATFEPAPAVTAPGARAIAIGDFDADGNQDLAVTGAGGVATVRTGGGPSLLSRSLLENGGAEQGVGNSNFGSPAIPGWARTGPMTFVRYSTRGLFPQRPDAQRWEGGEDFFSGGPNNAQSSATQTASVPVPPASIDAGLSTATLAADLGGYRTRDDRMQVTAEFLDGGGAALGSFSIGPVSAADRGNLTTLLRRAATQPMPAGTRSIRVTLTATRFSGFGYNLAFADNVKLTVASNDRDADGVGDGADNCPAVANAHQANNDGDGRGDACDADDDNDAVLDRADTCRLIAGKASNGCPKIARRLSLTFSDRSGKFSGRLRPGGPCAVRQRVQVLRVKRGPDKEIGRTKTKRSGRYGLAADANPGTYYAKVKPKTVADVGNCAKVKSKTVRVH